MKLPNIIKPGQPEPPRQASTQKSRPPKKMSQEESAAQYRRDSAAIRGTNEGWLSDFSDIIRRQGEQYNKRELERIARMEAELPATLETIPYMDNSELLDSHTQWGSRGYNCRPRERAIWRLLRIRTRKEILGRML